MTLPVNQLPPPSQGAPSGSLAGPSVGVASSGPLAMALESLLHKQEANTRAAHYYEGTTHEVFASFRMRRAMARTGVGFRFNFARTPVDALTDRLEIAAVKSTNERATEAIAQMWADNQLDLEIPNIHRRASEFGDAYVMVWPREEDNAPAAQPDGESVPVEVGIYYNSSNCVQLFYDDENPLKKSFAIKRWQRDDKRWRVDLLYAAHIERYLSKANSNGDEAVDYEPFYVDFEVMEGDNGQLIELPIWPVENPFGEVPVFHLRNDRPYGVPEHKGFYGPQDAINKLIVSHMAGVDYQSFPQRYALVAPDSDTSEAADLDEDEFDFAVPDTEGQSSTASAAGEGKSQFSADPGSLWYMRGVTSAGQFDTAKPEVFLTPMERYLRFGAQITTTPLRMFDYDASQMPSGASQSQADGPFVKKVRNRQLSYGATWQDVFAFALRVAGIEGADVSVLWVPPNTVDDKAGWETVGLKLAAGVPFEQVMREAGYSEAQVAKWMAERETATGSEDE